MGRSRQVRVAGERPKAAASFGQLRRHRWAAAIFVSAMHHAVLMCCTLSVYGVPGVSVAAAQTHGGKPVFDTVIVRNREPGRGDTGATNGVQSSANPSSGQRSNQDADAKPTGAAIDGEDGAAGISAAAVPNIAVEGLGWTPITPPSAATHSGSVDSANAGSGRNGNASVAPKAAEVRQVRVSVNGGKTHFHMTLSSGVRAEIFTLANPYRVIVDLPDVAFKLPDGTGQKGEGLISAFRYGLFADHKGRVVIDAAGPVRIEGAKMTPSGRGSEVSLEMELVSISEAEFGVGTGAAHSAAESTTPAARPAIFDDPLSGGADAKKPLVLIDPGHGGIDPGAVGPNSLLEKSVVLEVARRIERRLKVTGRYRVAMTRERDVFLSLDQRVSVSRELGADLFISLHADSLASKEFATQVRGATVYTLSERASDEQARLMAEKENASDQAAGIASRGLGVENEDVRGILIDLMKRETSNFSTDFSNLLVARLKQSVSVSRDPQRSAAFRVLKQTRAPSVLVELGYLSNDTDAKLMRQAEWQGKVARSIVAAVDAFFDKRTVRSGR